ncbi:MAG TPA: hypothetical protein PLN32_08835 [Methanoregulaceae archaeon]|nr:hypothetical protein [Methanoregulaceae archaeon]
MKHGIVIILGVFIALLVAIPVMAEAEGTSMNRDTAASNSGGSVIDTETPVLDGGIFSQYDTVFFHGSMAENHINSLGVYREGDWANCHEIILNASASQVYVNCPYFSYDSKQGGILPSVRYLGLQYMTSNQAEIYGVQVYNGASSGMAKIFSQPLKSTGDYSLQVIDLGEYIRFNRGLNMCLWIRNPSTTSYGQVDIGGYGARYEW